MAQCKITPQEFIKSAFTPQIAVLCSEIGDKMCRKNNLSFIELVQPFCKLSTDVTLKDPNAVVLTIRNLKITLLDANAQPPHPTTARKFLNLSVSRGGNPRLQNLSVGEYDLIMPSTISWFEAWRDTFLKVQYPSDHEFTKHFLACLLVVSSSDTNPIEKMSELNDTLNQMQNIPNDKLPKWFCPNILRYYVVIHDNIEGPNTTAVRCLESMKVMYGVNNCFLLRINSRPSGHTDEHLPDPWSQFLSDSMYSTDTINSDNSSNSSQLIYQPLEIAEEVGEIASIPIYHPLSPDTNDGALVLMDKEIQETSPMAQTLHGMHLSTEDIEQIKLLIHEFCLRALLPYIERLLIQLTDIVSNKKGVSRSLFSATKRWFTPKTPGSNVVAVNSLLYSPDSPELQMRRLGDLYFMFTHYTMAFQAYHSAKRDFNADLAWLHYAGALEMAGLAAFMANEATRKTCDYMEESITTYLNICKMAQFATRATLLCTECLKGRNLFGEAANQFIRMTSEESDLRSALLLEQAAYCFLKCMRPQMVRKYAFHMVLAGHRFSKALQKKHSLRCYKQAFQVYEGKGWNLAEDHIHYTIGKLAGNLHELEESIKSFSMLLTGQSKQLPQQQAVFLKEYLTIHNMVLKKEVDSELPILPLPLLDSESISVLVGPGPPLKTPGKVPAMGITFTSHQDVAATLRWNKLEEMLVQESQAPLPMLFKPLVTLYTNDNIINANPMAILGEPLQLSVSVHNPLYIPLNLKDAHLLWNFIVGNKIVATNENGGDGTEQHIKTHLIKSVVLQANAKQDLILSVTPLMVGEIVLTGICYCLINASSTDEQLIIEGKQLFDIKGPKVKAREKIGEVKPNKRLEIVVVPSAPCLQVNFDDMNLELLCNELQKVNVEMRNVGTVPLHKLYIASSVPHLMSTCELGSEKDQPAPGNKDKEIRRKHVTSVPLPQGRLNPGHCHNITLWLQAPDLQGPTYADILFYYENINSKCIPRYRLVRHIWQLSIQESLKINISTQHSCHSRTSQQLTLSLKVVNLNKAHHSVLTEIILTEAALFSKHWTLLKQILAPSDLKLLPQEYVHILLIVQRNESAQSRYSEASLIPGKQIRKNSNLVYLDFGKKLGQQGMNAEESESAEVSEDKEATLILRWKAVVTDSTRKKRKVIGQSYAFIDMFGTEDDDDESYGGKPVVLYDPNKSLVINTNNNDDSSLDGTQTQIMYNLVHPAYLCHDFETNQLCVVPVKLLLHSTSSTSLVVTVNTLGTSSLSPPPSFRPNLFYPYSSRQFRWLKAGSIIKTLEPLQSEVIILNVAVLSPGIYDLGARLELYCHQLNHPTDTALQICRIESSLIVTNEN